jgi:two-component system, NtrC family, sensor histidine kinase HydH
MNLDSTPQSPQTTQRSVEPFNIGEFMRLLAHELGNPVASIRMSAEMMVGDLPDDIRGQLSQIVFDEALRLEALIESAVFYTTLQPGTPLQVEVEPLLNSAVQQIETEVPIAVEIDERTPRTVCGDASQLTRMFREVIANAVESGATEVKVRAAENDLESIFTVEDNGEGIPRDKLSVIFIPFYTSRDGQLGLGLCIARKIAELNNGSITVAPAESGGTIVTLSLPSARPLPH